MIPPSLIQSARAPRNRRLPRRRVSFLGLGRVALYIFCASLAVAVTAFRSAYGGIQESAVIIGRNLAGFEDLLAGSYRVRLNGEPIYVASTMASQSVSEVLDRFETHCRQNANGLPELFSHLSVAMRRDFDDNVKGGVAIGTVRKQVDGEGMVACLARREGETGSNFPGRLRSAITTGDLSNVGDLRYVYARRQGEHGSQVITVWTDGPFRISNVAPPSGAEPPGTDSATAARPRESKRLLSVVVEGAPHSTRIYDVGQSVPDVLASFDADMVARGWAALPLPRAPVQDARVYTRDGREALLFVNAADAPDRSFVTLIESVVPRGHHAPFTNP